MPVMEQKKPSKSEYIKQFERDENGRYRYTGPTVQLSERWIQVSHRAFLMLAVSLVLQIIAGCLPAEVMKNTFYVIFPFGLGIGLTVLSIYHLYEVYEQFPAVPEYIWLKHGQSITDCLIAQCILCAVCAAGILVYTLSHPLSITVELLPALLEAVSAFLAWKAYRGIKEQEQAAKV